MRMLDNIVVQPASLPHATPTYLILLSSVMLLSPPHPAGNPLWYAHYDNKPSFSDFSSFGGWTTPYAKQYQGDYTLCGFDVDLDYAPTWSGR